MEKNSNHFGAGLFFGLALGVLAGILLAPSTGEETRRKILDSTEDLQNNLKNISKKMKSETDEIIKKGKDFIKDIEESSLKQTGLSSEEDTCKEEETI